MQLSDEEKLYKEFSNSVIQLSITQLGWVFLVFPLFTWNTNIHKITQISCSTQWAFTCSKLTIETLEQGVKYVQRQGVLRETYLTQTWEENIAEDVFWKCYLTHMLVNQGYI